MKTAPIITAAGFAAMLCHLGAEQLTRAEMMAIHDAKIAEFEKIFKTPISFWGIVHDQDAQPVAGAKVNIYVLDNPEWSEDGKNNSTYRVTADEQGKFQLLNVKGASLSANAKAEGYDAAYDESGNKISRAKFDYSDPLAASFAKIPTKDKPCVLVIRKKGPIANLHEIKFHKEIIQNDGTPALVEAKGTPIIIRVRCWSSVPDPYNNDPYSWRAELGVVGGKLQPVADENAVMAPKEKYQDLVRIEMPADIGIDWRRGSPRGFFDFWIKLDNGTYARLNIELSTGRDHDVVVRGQLNLDGTNSFEQ